MRITKDQVMTTPQAAALTRLKKQKETEWLREVNSRRLQAGLQHWDVAFVNFYEGRTWYYP